MNYILNSRADLDALAITDPAAHAEFLDRLRASLTTTRDVAEYPEDYDRDTPAGSKSYIAPAIKTVSTPETAARFGFTAKDLL